MRRWIFHCRGHYAQAKSWDAKFSIESSHNLPLMAPSKNGAIVFGLFEVAHSIVHTKRSPEVPPAAMNLLILGPAEFIRHGGTLRFSN